MTMEQMKSTSKKPHRVFKVVAIALLGVVGGGSAAAAFDLGGLSGFLDTVAPVLQNYGVSDISKYAGYLNTFQNVVSVVKKGSLNNVLSTVGSINKSIGESGFTIPSKLATDILDSVSANYTGKGGANGVGVVGAQDRALIHAQNVAHRAYVESVMGEEGQANIKKGVEGSGDLVKSAAEIQAKGAKSNISQKKLDAGNAIGVMNVAMGAQNYGLLTEIKINGAQQTEIQSGILEHLTGDKTAKTLSDAGARASQRQAGSVFAGLAGPTENTENQATEQKKDSVIGDEGRSSSTEPAEPTAPESRFGTTKDYVPPEYKSK
jgi:hypothetical protein